MVRHIEQRTVPYNAGDVFDVAADIEAYPDFVPLFASAKIIGRDDSGLHVEQVLNAGPLRLRFLSHAVLDRPRRIAITGDDDILGKISVTWTFEPLSEAETVVTLDIAHCDGIAPLSDLAEAIEAGLARRVFDAFRGRMAQKRPPPPSAPPPSPKADR